MEWNDDLIARLQNLWSEGHSTSEIGRRIGMSKNAVVGKAHRLNLPPRPSPIRREGMPGVTPRPQLPKRVTGPTLPPLSTATAPPLPQIAPAPRPAAIVPAAAPVLRALPVVRAMRAAACCWPLGEPGTKTFRFCDAEATPGKPYCADHAAVAYVRVKDKREDAA